MRIKSIRARLTFWYIGLLTITILVLGSSAYWLLVYSLAHDVDVSLRGVANVLVKQAHDSSPPIFPRDIDDIFRRFFRQSSRNRYFEMLDPEGRRDSTAQSDAAKIPLSQRAFKNASKGLHTYETVTGAGKNPIRLLTVPVIKSGHIVSLVRVGMSLESMYITRRRFLVISLAVLPVALLLAGSGGWLLARRALKPVDKMTATADRISAEALSDRLDETGTGDELDRLAKTLNRMLERLNITFDQMRRFSGDASHELQTPLTILKGELEVALRSPRSPEEYQGILKSALEEINSIAQLVDGLLLLARADAGVLRMDHKPVNLGQLVEDVYGRAQVLAEARNVQLNLEKSVPIVIQGDYERLRRLLLNLVDNGIKYTPTGGCVTLSVQLEDENACLIVSDTGIGIPPEEQKSVFQPFFRADKARAIGEEGVGLGLCIAKSISEAHHGAIELKSSPGEGSIFRVLLPIT